jgi:hypothetical protein
MATRDHTKKIGYDGHAKKKQICKYSSSGTHGRTYTLCKAESIKVAMSANGKD